MIVLPDQWLNLYDGVREDKHNTCEKKVVIFVNGVDCDSVCALKVLQAILIQSSITFSIHIVASQREFQARLLDDVGTHGQDLRTAFCINCGGTWSLPDLLAPLPPGVRDALRLVVIDSHRPIHHSFNDPDDTANVFLYDQGPHQAPFDLDTDDIPCAASIIDAEEASQGPPSQRRRTDENGDSQPCSSGDDRRAAWEAECSQYYSRGSQYGLPASMVLFSLAHQLNIIQPYLTWMAILGVTEQMLLRRVLESSPLYVWCMRELDTSVAELDMDDRQQRMCGEGFESDDEDDGGAGRRDGKQSYAQCGVIRKSTEYKFLLHRHWSLLEALMHSPVLAARLRTFKEGSGGRGSLEVLLARSGVPMAQAQLKYGQMKVQYKDAMLPNIAENIRLNSQKDGVSLSYDSFTLAYSNRLTLSAADHVQAISAHLEFAGGARSCTDFTGGFWDAYSATDVQVHGKTIMQGLQLSMSLHRKLLEDCNIVIQSGLKESTAAAYELVDLADHESWASSSPLVHPLSITRLAALLRDVMAYQWRDGTAGKAWKARPFVFVGPPDADGMCLVGAVQGVKATRKHPVEKTVLPTSHDGVLNVFGGPEGLFHQAIHGPCIHSALHDSPDSAVVQIHRTDVGVFLPALEKAFIQRDRLVWQKEGVIEPTI